MNATFLTHRMEGLYMLSVNGIGSRFRFLMIRGCARVVDAMYIWGCGLILGTIVAYLAWGLSGKTIILSAADFMGAPVFQPSGIGWHISGSWPAWTLIPGISYSVAFGLPFLNMTLIIALYVVLTVSLRGATPGMGSCHIHVITTNDAPLTWSRILLWHLVSILSGLCLGLGYLWAVFDTKGRTWHDIAAGLVVSRVTEHIGISPEVTPSSGAC